MSGPCPFSCTNKTEFGYCKTTACLYAPTIRVTSTPRTNADSIRAMTDEELAEWLDNIDTAYEPETIVSRHGWLEWLRQEATQ